MWELFIPDLPHGTLYKYEMLAHNQEAPFLKADPYAFAAELRPRTASDADYVVFRWLGQGCMSNLGRNGGAQDIDVTSCAGGNLVHELLHAAGFYHEQSRPDRDSFVSIERAERVLGYNPRYSNQDALVRNYRWYLANAASFEGASGVSHRVPWKQGALALAKLAFPRRA